MKRLVVVTILFVVLFAAPSGWAVKVSDLTHLQGQRQNRLTGLGLAIGLNGTGDGGKFMPSIRTLAAYLQHFQNAPMSLDELRSAKNVALVQISAVIGNNGAREGQQINVTVSAIGSAKSLEGGRLLISPLRGPNPQDLMIYAVAGGPITIDPLSPTTGTIENGADMERDVIYQFTSGGRFTLVIEDAHAGFQMASAIKTAINDSESIFGTESQLAEVIDAKSVTVTIPKPERKAPADFIARIQAVRLFLPEQQAKVTINARTQTIIITGQVTVGPTTIVSKGMTISTDMLLKTQQALAGQQGKDIYQSQSVELQLLVSAFDRLAVPAKDRITVIRELYRSGALRGQLVEQP